MLPFSPQDIGAKEPGRIAQCKASGLSYKEAAQFFTDATPSNFQSRYNSFIDAFPTEAKTISNLRDNGVGPGEMLAWFLFNNVLVGGANASCDLIVNGEDFAEMKAGFYRKGDHSLCDFKLSKDQDPSVRFIVDALSVEKPAATIGFDGIARDITGRELGLYDSATFIDQVDEIITENLKSSVDRLYRNKVIDTWKDQIFSEYLTGKTMALVQTSNLKMRYFGQLTKDMVGLYRIHRNQPWARVSLP